MVTHQIWLVRSLSVKPDQFKDIYNLTLGAQQAALDFIKPGVTAHEVDQLLAKSLKAGYGEYFNRLGHCNGMDNEFLLSWKETRQVIEEGMCFSVEPGIYIPGKVGVRIETAVLLPRMALTLQHQQRLASLFWLNRHKQKSAQIADFLLFYLLDALKDYKSHNHSQGIFAVKSAHEKRTKTRCA